MLRLPSSQLSATRPWESWDPLCAPYVSQLCFVRYGKIVVSQVLDHKGGESVMSGT